MDDLIARLRHGEGQDWDLPYATRAEAADALASAQSELASLRAELAAAHTRLIACDLILQTNVRTKARNDRDEQMAVIANREYFRAHLAGEASDT